MLAKPLAATMYPSILNSFPVIRTANAKIDVFTYRNPHFCFPWRRPCDYHHQHHQFNTPTKSNMLHGWKDNSVFVKPIAACTHLSSTVSQLFEPQVQQIAVFTYRNPHFCFPWRRPCDYHAKCCMDEIEFDAYKLSRCMCPSNYNRF